jgi:cytoskeleton protein RodZ
MQTLGQRLRAEREKLGRSIADLAGKTRIRSEYFEALENGRPDQFPGPFFYRSFLRQYAALLELPESVIEPEIQRSLDEERAVAQERDAQQTDSRPDVAPLPTGRSDLKAETRRWLTRLASLVAVLAVCSGAYFAWQRWGQRFFQEERGMSSPARPARQEAAQRPATASAPPSATQAPATPVEKQPLSEQPAPAAVPVTNAEQPEAAPAAPAPGAAAGPAQAPREGDLTVQASDSCWVDGWRDGRHFYGAMLRAGSAVGFAGSGTLRLRFGNAGAVTVRLKGQTLGAIGPRGQVRTIEVQNGEYRVVPPAPPAPVKQ